MKVLIVGGVAGGASTAARLRRLSEQAEIIVLERGTEVSYANCGIPYHIGEVITDREKLVMVTPDYFRNTLKVDVRTLSEVTAVDRAKKRVTIHDAKNNHTYEEEYDYLVLSPGGSPVRPPISGITDPRIFTIRNLQDMDAIKKYITDKKPRTAVVVGAGFIGLEMAENLKHLGLAVSIVELADQVMNLMDYEMATIVHQHLKAKNIGLYLHDAVKAFVPGDTVAVQLNSGRSLAADLVILSIGVRPETVLASSSGLTLGTLGGIAVNERLQTSDPHIYALGDVIEVIDSVCNCPALIPLANAANKQGRIVADNIVGGNKVYRGTPGTAIAKVFDLTVAMTGTSEKRLKKQNFEYGKVHLQPGSHAGYYPDAYPMFLKLLYQKKDGRILGAQIVGHDGIDKRIDVIAALVQQRQTVYALAELELAYAPPFSSAKDPVNLAAMIAINQLEGKHPVVFWHDVPALQQEGAVFIDVRTPLEYKLNHLPGALSLPLAELRSRMQEIPKDKKVVLYCNQGKQAYFALTTVQNLGYTNCVNLSGGIKLYQMTAQPQEHEVNYVDKRDDVISIPQPTATEVCVDACGLQCPGPIMRLAKEIDKLAEGDVLTIKASDPGFRNDVGAWCETTGNTLLANVMEEGLCIARIKKGHRSITPVSGEIPHDKTLVVFSNDLDKAIASFVIANGALALGRKVTMFFTFWGLNILRKSQYVKTKKSFLDMMFGLMMPRGSKKLHLSKMDMGGIGGVLIRYVMKSKNIDSLETLMQSGMAGGIKIIACQMSMDVMGIKKEELIDGVEIGGVANYLNAAEKSDTNLFI
jgi:NADPH-dependent 2,4-dienoyl-CoA reductase/sulfur reductase-like enzyme/peroxiredoxin family protein/rhodanese-related sulfurtransferase/TusA-related sulfurtransferase